MSDVYKVLLSGTPLKVVLAEKMTVTTGSSVNYDSYTAGATINGNRVCYMNTDGKVYLADSTNLNHYGRVIGLSKTSGTANNSINLQYKGNMTNAGWSLTAGSPCFFDSTGAITQTAPATGFSQIIGYALDATTININIQIPLKR